MIDVIYLLNEDGEAEHTRRFCSHRCQITWKPNEFEVDFAATEFGTEDDVGAEGECCETCGKTI